MSNKFDLRTIERKIKTGEITEEEYQQYLDSLPDESDNATDMDVKFVYASEAKKEEQK
jgi:hypothetical protein